MESKSSFKRTNPADAANIFVRNLLCDISEELGGFTENDWKKTLKYFDNCCAYTGVKLPKSKIVQDHLIPHNRQTCGLHLFGNIVPASKEANAAKSYKDFETFIRTDTSILGNLDEKTREDRILKIKKFQIESGYFEQLEKLKRDISLKDFVNYEYDFILNKAKENKKEIAVYVNQIPENQLVIINSTNKDINQKIETWASKPYSNVHKIITLILQNENISRSELLKYLEDLGISKNPAGAINSLMTNNGNSYGRIIQELGGGIIFCPEVKSKILSYKWSI